MKLPQPNDNCGKFKFKTAESNRLCRFFFRIFLITLHLKSAVADFRCRLTKPYIITMITQGLKVTGKLYGQTCPWIDNGGN